MKNFIKLSVFVSLILQASIAYPQWSNGSSQNGIPQITYTGRVSIGGSAVGSYYPTLTLKARNHNKVLECFDANGNLMLAVNTSSNSPYLKLYDRGSSDIVRVSSSGTSFFNGGNVGIGTRNPGNFRLAVLGRIRATECVLETGWSDFVFDDNYQLPTLQQVKAFIKENGHLPDIPSEEEVAKNGVSVAEMESKLLQKIEELTLYVIAQEEKMQSMEQELQKIKANVNQ